MKNCIYLNRLPKSRLGSWKNGEIELLDTIPEEFEEEALGCVYQDKYVTVVKDIVRFPSGGTGTYIRIFEAAELHGKSNVAVLPIQNDKILLLKIFRHATRRWEIEIPRGMCEENESEENAAMREVSEETGYAVESIIRIGEVCPNTGLLTGSTALFLAILGQEKEQQTLEEAEVIERLKWVECSELRQCFVDGTIRDCYTIAAVQLATVMNLLKI